MSREHETADFLNADFQASVQSPFQSGTSTAPGMNRPLTREELEQRVGETQNRLAELKRAQEQLEKERAALEEARRRRSELHTGREEMVTHLTRGITLIEEAEFAARHDAEQMAKTLANFRDAISKVQSVREEQWTEENWNAELTRALTIIENARMEWNGARLKWPLLNAPETTSTVPEKLKQQQSPISSLEGMSLGQMCKIGLALTWPLALAIFGGFLVLVAILMRK